MNKSGFRVPSPFQQRVYAVCRRIPAGRVTTYAALARMAGCRSPRAVGQALRCNPFAPEVPCHRVISSTLSIGGFQGKEKGRAIALKQTRLRAEGVLFRNGRLVDPARLWPPPGGS